MINKGAAEEKLTAFVLAGGAGTRLRPAVSDRPKVLAEVDGRPFLSYQLDYLSRGGVTSVVLCTGIMADQIEDAIGLSYGDMTVRYSREDHPLGTGGALRRALPLADTDPVLVVNGDSLLNVDLRKFRTWAAHRSAAAALMLARVGDISQFGAVDVDDYGFINGFREKGSNSSEEGWINAGIYLLTRAVIATIPEGVPVSIEKEVFPVLAGKGLLGYKTSGSFIDIGTPESYQRAAEFLKQL